MTAGWDGQALLVPISEVQPCGRNLEATVLAALEIRRLFGQRYSLQPQPAQSDNQERGKEPERIRVPPDWGQIRTTALEGLEQSKDLRLLAYLGTASLWIEDQGLPAFADVLTTASQWLQQYWTEVYPLLDGDAVERRNALNCLADPMAVLDRVAHLPLAESRQHGRFSLSAIELVATAAGDDPSRQAAMRAAFADMPLDRLAALERSMANGSAALVGIDSKMRDAGGPEAAPDFDRLLAQFAKIGRILREQIGLRTNGNGAGTETALAEHAAASSAATGSAAFVVGAITSRQEAVRALDAVADFFRRNEPSSPVPLFVERAKRLVSKDFLEVLADVAPDAVAGARSAGGLKPDR